VDINSGRIKGNALSKLFKLKEWVTVADAARHLSIVFGEEVSEADVLRLALDEHLKISVHLVNGAYARYCIPRKFEEIERESIPSLDGKSVIQVPKHGRVWADWRGIFQVFPGVTELESAVWDLPLTDGGRVDVERQYQTLTGGPELTTVVLDGVLVASTAGYLYELQCHFSDNSHFKGELKKPYLHPDNFHPAGALPEDSVLVVRTEALRDFEKSIAGSGDEEKALSTTERTSLLKMVIGMAIKGYSYDPEAKKSTATKDILKDLDDLGVGLDAGTLLKWLRQARDEVLPTKTN
jgi:hypothetical protein